jgi:hypothetical protein
VYYSSKKEMSWIDLGRAMLVALLVPASVAAQLQVSTITGRVLDAGGQAVVGATVVLQDSTGTTASHERSDRFLDPVDPDNLHNEGWAAAATAQFTLRTTSSLFTASAQGGRNGYEVPDDFAQEQAGQDQRHRMAQLLGSGSWQRIVSDRTCGRHRSTAVTAPPR